MKKLLMATLIGATCIGSTLSAGGIGLYVPYSIGQSYSGSLSSSSTSGSYDYDGTLKNKMGIGFVYDSNPNSRNIYNYRFGFEYTKPVDDKVSDANSATNYMMVHTFGFGVVRTKIVRLWMGPRLNIGYESYDKDGFKKAGLEFGIAPAIGINFNIASVVSLGMDLDYKFAAQFGGYENPIDTGTYSESRKGMTTRLHAMFIF